MAVDGGISVCIILRLPMFEYSNTGEDSYNVNVYFLSAKKHKTITVYRLIS